MFSIKKKTKINSSISKRKSDWLGKEKYTEKTKPQNENDVVHSMTKVLFFEQEKV
jgi:hypothetical protein